jgi:hypothetical protein
MRTGSHLLCFGLSGDGQTLSEHKTVTMASIHATGRSKRAIARTNRASIHDSAFSCRPMPTQSSKDNRRILGLFILFIVVHRPSWRFFYPVDGHPPTQQSYTFCDAWSLTSKSYHSKKGMILHGRRFNYFQSKKMPSKIHHNVMKVRRRDDCDDGSDDDVSSLLDMTLQGVVVAQCLHVFVKLRLAECFVEENHHEPYEQQQQRQQTTISSVSHKQGSHSTVRESGGSRFEPPESCSSVSWSTSSSLSSSFTCRSLDYLAQYSSSHADRLLRILRVLCTNDIVREQDNLTFSLSRKGQALLVVLPPPSTNHSSSSSSQSTFSAASSMIQYLLDGPIWNSWNYLTDYVLEEEDTSATLLSSSTTTTNTTSGNDKDAIAATFSRGTPFERANHKLTTQEYYSTHPMALHNANRFVGYMFD